ncbi:MAG: hypothetical protein WCY54_06060, partial [Syntrophales bacterium]
MAAEKTGLTFVVAVNDFPVYENNFLSSPCLRSAGCRIVTVSGFPSASTAYNEGILRAQTDLVIFAHQDVFLPESWLDELERSLEFLEREDASWGVLGCYGIAGDGKARGVLVTAG